MESPAPSASVVSLSTRQAARQAAVSAPGLGGEVQEMAKKALGDGVTKAFASIDDDLFRRSEVKQELFEGLRELRKRQPLITRLFLEQVDKDIAQALQPPASVPTSSNPPAPAAPQALSLVEEGELEESLAVTRMVAAADSALAGEIHALRARTAVLRGGVSPEDVEIPLAPHSVANAFRQALDSAASIQMAERIVVYKYFERTVMGRLGPLYHEINARLAAAGVLPNLQPQVMVRNHADPSSHSSVQDHGPTQAGGALSAPVPGGGGAQGGTMASGGFMAPPGAPVSLSPQEQAALMEFRQVVATQRQPGSGGEGPAASLSDLGQAILALREIHSLLGQLTASGVAPSEVKTHLLEKLGRGTPSAKSLGDHEDAIDMVGLVFDHILNDPNLPPPMQALLARLQVPFIKVAVLEPHLFAKTDHPARLLLDLLGETGKAWTPEADRERMVYNRMKQVVDEVNERFVDDAEVFSHQRAQFQQFVDDLSRRAGLTQQRAQEVAQSREKMEQAQAVVTQNLIGITAGKSMPEWVRTLLLRHWASYMVLLVLREGPQSSSFNKALYLAQKVVEAPASQDDAAKRALMTVAPALVDQLKEGLGALGLGVSDIGRLADTLKSYLEMHAGAAPVSSSIMPPLPPAPNSAPLLTARKGPQPSERSLEAVRGLKVGDWVELVNETGRKTRGKVSWISSFTHRVLIVTLSGTRLAERPQEELAVMLDRGQMRLLENRALFDRAMGSIVEKIRGH